jgi:hypothetical protein
LIPRNGFLPGRHGVQTIVTTLLYVWFVVAPSFLAADASLEKIAVFPPSIDLSGVTARQRIIVERLESGRAAGECADVRIVSDDPAVAAIHGDFVVGKREGKTRLAVTSTEGTRSVEVVVRRSMTESTWDFRTHVQSVLTRHGCNSGACHGAIAGKNGFRLSLRGFDPDADYSVLVKQARGRRIDVDRPGRSLILLKASAAVPHGGGERLKPGSPDFNVISEWIAQGARPPKADDAVVESVEIYPHVVQLRPSQNQQFVVRARWSDGRFEDVTHWTKYTATNAEVAQIDEGGRATGMGHGEAAIVAWYQNKLAVATITSPYAHSSVGPVATLDERNFVDELVNAKLRELGIPASPRCTDGEFIRRASLDALGVLPTAAEVREFLGDRSPDKRDRLIERLLNRPEFVDFWSYKWSDLLLVNSEKLQPAAARAYYGWIRRHVAAGTPWDVMVRDLLTAQGESLENGAVNFFVLHTEPTELVETISTAFMGMPLNCCRCHNHPMEKWTNDDYYGFLNLAARVRRKSGDREGGATVFVAASGDLVQPRSGKILPPRPLDGAPIPQHDPSDRRVALAEWLVSPKNPYFSRAIVNRIWTNFMGEGLVEKVDDLRLTNPASNEALLAALAKRLAEEKYDLKALMTTIMKSAAYQRSSVPQAGNAADRRFYSRYYPRRLMAEVLLDAASQVTAAPTEFPNYPKGWRALQLPDSNVSSYFLEKFGRPDRLITCDCERNSEPSVVQVLHLSNGDALNKKLQSPGNVIERQLKTGRSVEAILEDLYLSAVARTPTQETTAKVVQWHDETPVADRRKFWEDVYWGVLSSKEFLFNH